VLLIPLLLLLDTHPHLVHAVLHGRLTIRDAESLAAGIADLDDAILGSCYHECHKHLVVRCAALGRNIPPIEAPVESIEALEAELARMPFVSDAFVRGQLTLVQARYAHRMALTGEALDTFVARAERKRAAMSRPPIAAKPVLSLVPTDERGRLLTALGRNPAFTWYAERLVETGASLPIVQECVRALNLDPEQLVAEA